MKEWYPTYTLKNEVSIHFHSNIFHYEMNSKALKRTAEVHEAFLLIVGKRRKRLTTAQLGLTVRSPKIKNFAFIDATR